MVLLWGVWMMFERTAMTRKIGFLMPALAFMLITMCSVRVAAANEPPGYIFVAGWYKDLGLQRAYNEAVVPVLREFGYERSVMGTPGVNLRVVEGDWTPRMTLLIKFPSEERAKAFWWSDAYQQVKQIRMPVSAVDIVQVEGVEGVVPLLNAESAYLVFLAEIKDRPAFEADYLRSAPAVVKQHGGRFLVSASRADLELLEGEFGNMRLAIVEFASAAALRGFWDSAEYQRLAAIRRGTGKWSVVEIMPRPAR